MCRKDRSPYRDLTPFWFPSALKTPWMITCQRFETNNKRTGRTTTNKGVTSDQRLLVGTARSDLLGRWSTDDVSSVPISPIRLDPFTKRLATSMNAHCLDVGKRASRKLSR